MRTLFKTTRRTALTAFLPALFLMPVVTHAENLTVPNAEHTTIQSAIDALVTPGTITIKRGTYEESLVLRSDITIVGEETAQVKIDSPDSGPAIDLQNVNQVIIRNLSIVSSTIGIQITDSQNVDIHNNVFSLGNNANPSGSAIEIQDAASQVTVRHNTFFANNIAIDRAEDMPITNNIFFNNNADTDSDFAKTGMSFNCLDSALIDLANDVLIDPNIDPMFADQAADDFHLRAGSPCIDKISGSTDLVDATPADMGAYGGADMDILPFPPQNLQINVTAGDPHSVAVSWNENLSYLVSTGGQYEIHYDFEQPPDDNRVYDGNETGSNSPIVVDAADPASTTLLIPPGNITSSLDKPVFQVAPSSRTLELSWAPVANATSYSIHYGIADVDDTVETTTNTEFTITGLINYETYQVTVKALHQPVIYIALKTLDNRSPRNESTFSQEKNQNVGNALESQFDVVTAIPEIVEPFPDVPGEGCFIATAAWGYYSAPQVQLLRDFRDQYLLTNKPGRLFVDWYYTHGPEAAAYLRSNPEFKPLVRALLYPLVQFSEFMLHTAFLGKLLIISAILMLLMLAIAQVKRKHNNYIWKSIRENVRKNI